MSSRKLLALAALLAAHATLAAAFLLVGSPIGAALAVLCAASWGAVLAFRWPGGPTGCLVLALLLTVIAAAAGAPSSLGALASALVLAAWDLTLLERDLAGTCRPLGVRRLERAHLLALAGGLAPGVALALFLGRAQLRMPFPAVLALGVLALLGLKRAVPRGG